MKIIVFGGDGFCGWPTTLRLLSQGYEVLIVDNLIRRWIDEELSSGSLTEIQSISERVKAANEIWDGRLQFRNIDVAKNPEGVKQVLKEYRPQAVVQFAEQRAAPYSMLDDSRRRFTVDNNISGTHNICSAIVDVDQNIHLVHLGTMGVYGYSKALGSIPEGYLPVNIPETGEDVSILYPANPGSVYHLTKCLDQLVFQFYNKNWGLRITDLHQGIVWGIETEDTRRDGRLVNRFDYDGIYGTVLNRFISQAAVGEPLTVYGTGGQTRAFIHISDTARCVSLAIENAEFDSANVRIFNQVSETRSVLELAGLLREHYGATISFKENPRKELPQNELAVSNEGLVSLGFNPITLNEGLIEDVKFLAEKCAFRLNAANIMSSPKW